MSKQRFSVEVYFEPGFHHEVVVHRILSDGRRVPVCGHEDSTDSLSLPQLLRPALADLMLAAAPVSQEPAA